MAIAFRAAGTDTGSNTDPTSSVPLPVGWQAGDMLVWIVNVKSTVAITTPTGWTAPTDSNVTGGSGSVSIDTGINRVAVFFREAQAGDTATTLDLASAPNVSQTRILAYSKGAGESWAAVVCASGSDTTGSATSYGPVTGSTTIDLASGDFIGQVTGFNGDAGTPGTRTFSVPGVTLGTYSADSSDVATTVGGDLRTDAGTAPYSSGTASGAPSYERTWTSGNAAFSGATVFFRLRVTAASTPITVADTGAGTDAVTVAAKTPIADTGAGTDAVAVAATVPIADTATATDAVSVLIPIPVAETGTGTDAVTVTVKVPVAETAAGTDAVAVTAKAPVADTAAGTDAAVVAVAVPVSETATATDAVTVVVKVPVAETATATDTLTVNTGTTPVPVADTAAGTDAVTVAARVPVAETGIGTDAVTVVVSVPVADTAVADDALGVTAIVPVADTATATDTVIVADVTSVRRDITFTVGVGRSRRLVVGAGSSRLDVDEGRSRRLLVGSAG